MAEGQKYRDRAESRHISKMKQTKLS